MLQFYTDNAVEYVCFNVEEQEGANARSKLVGSQSADASYRTFLARFIDLAVQRRQNLGIREVDNALSAIRAHGKLAQNNGQAEPFGIVSVDCEGNISTFSPELLGLEHPDYGSFCFGNLLKDDFEEIAARVEKSRLYADIKSGIRQCRDVCAYYGLCGGGSPSNKIYENGSAASTETVYCRTIQRSIDVVLDLMERVPQDLAQFSPPTSINTHGRQPGTTVV